jgi:di/tricarboxylate transporter
MTLQQMIAFGLIAATIGAFLWGRWRYDLVAVTALLAGIALGTVPVEDAFDGFSNDIVVIIASALVVSAAIARSGLIERLARPLLARLATERSQVPVLAGAVTLLSMVTKNVGALAIVMPLALQVAKRTGSSPGRLLMPMSFGSLVGGLAILVGTSPNIIVSGVRERAVGEPFRMFDFMPVGLGLAVMAVAYLAFAYRMLPKGRQAQVSLDAALAANAYVTEVEAPETFKPRRVAELRRMAGEDVNVVGLLRGGARQSNPHPNVVVRPGDTLLLEGEQQALDALITRGKLRLTRSDRPVTMEEPTDEVRVVEAVIGPDSPLIGGTAKTQELHTRHGVNLLGVSRSGYRMTQRLQSVRLRAGDILVLQGGERGLPGALTDLGCLPLAEREVRLGGIRRVLTPALVLAGAMALVAVGLVPVAIAFFGAAVLIVALGALRMREAYAALDGPMLVLIAALIPVSNAVQASGGTDLLAGWLTGVFRDAPPILALGSLMLLAMAATPFLNNAATVLIMAPVGMSLARQLGLNIDPFLMAVAVGAGCDFLTPVGHQCNTLILGPGGYRFADYARLGAPLSVLVLVVGTPLIALFWPLTPA